MRNALMIAWREYIAYVTAWGFWLGLLLTPIALSIGLALPLIVDQTTPARYFTVIDADGNFEAELIRELESSRDRQARQMIETTMQIVGGEDEVDAALQKYSESRAAGRGVNAAISDAVPGRVITLPAADYVPVKPPATSIEGLTPYLTGERFVSGELGERPLFAAIIVTDERTVEYWSDDVVSNDLIFDSRRAARKMARNLALNQAGLDPGIIDNAEASAMAVLERSPSGSGEAGAISLADRAPFFIALAMSFMLWLLIFSVVNFLLTGTIEERSNKIFDALLTSVSLPQLLTGKLLGVLALSVTLVGVWTLASLLLGARFAGDIPKEVMEGLALAGDPKLVIPTVLSFILGYLMFGSVFLAMGSLCDTIQEAQSLMSPIIIIMLIPLGMLPVTIANPSSLTVEILSWVPLLTPFLLILRIPSDPPLWTIIGQILFMAGFTALTLWGAVRVYRAGAVHGAGVADVRSWFRMGRPQAKT